jgi:DNA-binding response OmpR family regulator
VPDLVVLDIELPGNVNGWQVLQALRTLARIPVLITSSSPVAVRQYMHNRGETRVTLDHLPKPFPMQTLLKRVKRMLPITDQ